MNRRSLLKLLATTPLIPLATPQKQVTAFGFLTKLDGTRIAWTGPPTNLGPYTKKLVTLTKESMRRMS